MEEIYRYLDSVRTEMDKLQVEYQTRAELFECLKKDHDMQVLKFEAAQLQIEKQAQLLDTQVEEISAARGEIENLKTILHEKELAINHLSTANGKIREEFGEKLHKLEAENKELLLALDGAYSRNKELDQMLCASNEIIGLKRLLLDYEKCIESDSKRGKIILKLEDYRNVQEQLKWKQEQLEATDSALTRTYIHLEGYHAEVSPFLKKIESQVHVELQPTLFEEAQALDELLDCQLQLDKQIPKMEKIPKGSRGDVIEISPHLKEDAFQLQALSEAKMLEAEVRNQSKNEQKNTLVLVKKLEIENGVLSRDKMGQSENKDILAQVEEICNQINEFCYEDVKLTKILEKILQSTKEYNPELGLISSDEIYSSAQDKTDIPFGISAKKFEAAIDERCPLKEINH